VTYLLDTGIWLWSVGEPSRISRKAREVMADSRNDVFLSAVTSWEVAIKAASASCAFRNRRICMFHGAWQLRAFVRLLCLTSMLWRSSRCLPITVIRLTAC